MNKFQSTPPVWVVTEIIKQYYDLFRISIHTTRVGGDSARFRIKNFIYYISIHTTRVGGDRQEVAHLISATNFNPHHPCGW